MMFPLVLMFAAIASTALIVFVPELDTWQVHVAAAGLLATALVTWRIEPPPIGSRLNHALLVIISAGIAAGLWIYQPGGSLAVAGGILAGPMITVRNTDRRHLAAHLLLASALIGAVIFSGAIDGPTRLAAVLTIASLWTMAAAALQVLEAAEEQSRELDRLVRRDALTGAGNRRMSTEVLDDALARHHRTGRAVSLLIVDIEDFGAVNEHHGHDAGDQLLRDVAGAIADAAGGGTLVARHGADEFCVVLPGAHAVAADKVAAHVRDVITALLRPDGEPVRSAIGRATVPDDASARDALMDVAAQRASADRQLILHADAHVMSTGATPNRTPLARGALSSARVTSREPEPEPAAAGRSSSYALAHGMAHTRETLALWRANPWPVLSRWFIGSSLIAAGLLVAVAIVASQRVPDPMTGVLPGVVYPAGFDDVVHTITRNSLVLALHSMACVAGFIAGTTMPLEAANRGGAWGVVHDYAGRFAILFVTGATTFSLLTQAFVLGGLTSDMSARLDLHHAELIMLLLPHALPELIGLFLPLAAWLIASRHDEWHQLLAATFVTTAIAAPIVLTSAIVEVYVTPELVRAYVFG